MELIRPLIRPDLESNSKWAKRYREFTRLIDELSRRDLPGPVINKLNTQIERLNAIPSSDKRFHKELSKKKSSILRTLEKDIKLVTKHYYRNLWMVLGMTVFGIPMGMVLGTALGNMAFLGIGIPIGMTIGLGVGSGMDEKAKKEGRQLNATHDF